MGDAGMVKMLGNLALTLALGLAAGCAAGSTHLQSVWVAPNLKGPVHFNKVLVLAIAKDPSLRQEVEGHIAVLLKRANGVPAYMAIPESAYGEPGKLKSILTENGYDGVITVRLVSTTMDTTWVPAYYTGFYGYYNWAYPTVMTPGYLQTDTKIRLETKIYSLKDEALYWAGLSDTFNVTDSQQIVSDLAQAIIKDLQERGLVEK
jgi:hypothetical protein